MTEGINNGRPILMRFILFCLHVSSAYILTFCMCLVMESIHTILYSVYILARLIC